MKRYYYHETEFTTTCTRCLTPFDHDLDTPAPTSYEEARTSHDYISSTSSYSTTVTCPIVEAGLWKITATSFDITADLSDVISTHGPGIYEMVTWASVEGETTVAGVIAISYPLEKRPMSRPLPSLPLLAC